MKRQCSILWFRGYDLRLADNPALDYALSKGDVIPLYIDAPAEMPWAMGSACRSWLHHSLNALDQELKKRGSRLIIRQGEPSHQLQKLITESSADEVVWLRSAAPNERQRDSQIQQQLNIPCHRFAASLLFQHEQILNKQGLPYRVFTPYWRACQQFGLERTLCEAPDKLPTPNKHLNTLPLNELSLLPKEKWDSHFYYDYQPGEQGAEHCLERFITHQLLDYADKRDQMDLAVTSRLSPHLRFGEIAPQRIVNAIHHVMAHETHPGMIGSAEKFLAELGWREFAHMILYHFPHTCEQPLNEKYQDFPWQEYSQWLSAWQKGETGIPLIDAGMRELWQTGTMHNRVRMVVASFLTKNCGIHWLQGARWFWDTLLDAELAANSLNWQWVAGCGADAAPYYRIFNPVTQGEKFDRQGTYVKRWLPELAHVPERHLHQLWTLDTASLANYGIKLGENYPQPIIDLKQSREAALARYQAIR